MFGSCNYNPKLGLLLGFLGALAAVGALAQEYRL